MPTSYTPLVLDFQDRITSPATIFAFLPAGTSDSLSSSVDFLLPLDLDPFLRGKSSGYALLDTTTSHSVVKFLYEDNRAKTEKSPDQLSSLTHQMLYRLNKRDLLPQLAASQLSSGVS